MIPPEVIYLKTIKDQDYDPEKDQVLDPCELQAYRDFQKRVGKEEAVLMSQLEQFV